jgi:hypothetical protein
MSRPIRGARRKALVGYGIDRVSISRMLSISVDTLAKYYQEGARDRRGKPEAASYGGLNTIPA